MLRSIFFVFPILLAAVQLTSAAAQETTPTPIIVERDPRGLTESKPAQTDIPQDNGVLKIPPFYMPNRAFAGRYRPSRDIGWEDVISVLRDPRQAEVEPTVSDIPQDNGILKIPPFYMPNRAFAGRYRTSRSAIDMDDTTMIPPVFDYSLLRHVRGLTESKPLPQSDIPQDNGILKIPPFYMPNRAFAGRYRPSRSIIEGQAGSVLDYPFELIFNRGPRDTAQENPESNLIIPPWYMPNRAFAGRYANRQPKPQAQQ